DVIVVIDPAQVGELQVSCQRSRLVRDPFHHAAVAAQRVNVIIEQLEARAIEVACEPALADRHTDTRRDTLPQWPGGGLDTGGPAVFGVARAFAVELSKALDVLERHR